jgi:hemerythrin superfamily protein
MEELFKTIVMIEYLEESNLKDTTTIDRIKLLKAESKALFNELGKQYIDERFKQN